MVKRAIEGMIDKRVGYFEEYPEKKGDMGTLHIRLCDLNKKLLKKLQSLSSAYSEPIHRISQRVKE